MGWPEAIVKCVGIATAGGIAWKVLSMLLGSEKQDDEEQ